jgi:hypothetical protein
VLLPEEAAVAKAEQEHQKVDRLTAQLRVLGIDPEA